MFKFSPRSGAIPFSVFLWPAPLLERFSFIRPPCVPPLRIDRPDPPLDTFLHPFSPVDRGPPVCLFFGFVEGRLARSLIFCRPFLVFVRSMVFDGCCGRRLDQMGDHIGDGFLVLSLPCLIPSPFFNTFFCFVPSLGTVESPELFQVQRFPSPFSFLGYIFLTVRGIFLFGLNPPSHLFVFCPVLQSPIARLCFDFLWVPATLTVLRSGFVFTFALGNLIFFFFFGPDGSADSSQPLDFTFCTSFQSFFPLLLPLAWSFF